MRDVLLWIFVAFMAFASIRHLQAWIQRRRAMRSLYRDIANAGRQAAEKYKK